MKSMLKEFKDFVNRGDVVTIAVGLVMALYFKTIVDEFINGVINPLIAAIFGESSFTDIGFTVNGSLISIGRVINALVTFVIVSFILFLVVKAYNRYVLKPKVEETLATEVELLAEIRDLLAQRQGPSGPGV